MYLPLLVKNERIGCLSPKLSANDGCVPAEEIQLLRH